MTAGARLRRPESLVALVAVVMALAAIATVAWRSAERTHTTVVLHTGLPTRLSADDCPLGVTCVDGAPRALVAQLLAQALPGTQVLDAYAIFGTAGADELTPQGPQAQPISQGPYREVVHARTASGIDIQLMTRRIPNGAAVSATPISKAAIGPATVSMVVPGTPGSSVAIVADVPSGVAVPTSALDQLVHRPELQLRN